MPEDQYYNQRAVDVLEHALETVVILKATPHNNQLIVVFLDRLEDDLEDLATIIGVTTEKLIEVSGNIKKYIYFKRKTTGTKKRLFIIPNKELRRIQTPINKNVLQRIKVPQEIGGGKKSDQYIKTHCHIVDKRQ